MQLGSKHVPSCRADIYWLSGAKHSPPSPNDEVVLRTKFPDFSKNYVFATSELNLKAFTYSVLGELLNHLLFEFRHPWSKFRLKLG